MRRLMKTMVSHYIKYYELRTGICNFFYCTIPYRSY